MAEYDKELEVLHRAYKLNSSEPIIVANLVLAYTSYVCLDVIHPGPHMCI